MTQKRVIQLPTYNVNLGDACVIVKRLINDDSIAIQTKVIAIERVARMETHNSITKDDLIKSLRWLFDHFDF